MSDRMPLDRLADDPGWFPHDEARDTAFLSGPRDRWGEIPPALPEPALVSATPFIPRAADEIAPRQWLYGRRLIRSYVSATIAPGGVGKSTLVVADALAIATGRKLLHEAPFQAQRVWLWSGEDPLEEAERRIVAAMAHHRIDSTDFGGNLFVDSGRDRPIRIAETEGGTIRLATPVIDALVAEIKRRDVDVLIIDPFVQVHGTSENDNVAIDRVVKSFASIAHQTSCAIELVHHSRKLNGAEADADSARGASALIAAVRSCRVLNPMSTDHAKGFGISDEDRRSYVRIDDAKANLAPPGTAHWFRLASVGLGNATAERQEDLVAVAASWSPPTLGDGLPPDADRLVRAAVAGKGYRRDARSTDWVGYAVASALEMNAYNETDLVKIKRLIRGWLASGVLVEVEITDSSRKRRKAIDAGESHD